MTTNLQTKIPQQTTPKQTTTKKMSNSEMTLKTANATFTLLLVLPVNPKNV